MPQSKAKKKHKKPTRRDLRIEFARVTSAGLNAVGRFTFEFSQLEFSIRVALLACLKLPQEYFDIVTAPYDFAMLCKVTREAMTLKAPERKDELEEWCKECLKLNEDRVRMAHGTWTLGSSGPSVRHVSRNTLKAHHYFGTPAEIHRLADEAQRLLQAILGFKPTPGA
jgi:hypothetical protein